MNISLDSLQVKQAVPTLLAAAAIACGQLMLCPVSARAQGGLPLWTNPYDGPAGGDGGAVAMAVDSRGDVFVTGGSYGGGSGFDYATIKYSNAGVPLWTNLYTEPGYRDDFVKAIGVDNSGNVFVTGSLATIKYSGAGTPLWTNRWNGAAIAVDGIGNVFVTGTVFSDYMTIACSNSGVPLWTNLYDGPAHYSDVVVAIAVDSSGNVFVTGQSDVMPSLQYYEYATIKYSGAGVPIWTNRYAGPTNGFTHPSAIAVDGNGNVFVTGRAWNGTNLDYATLAYSNSGVPLWTNLYNGPANKSEEAAAIAIDRSGNVVVTGYSDATVGTRNDRNYATIAYSNSGLPLWTNRYDGPDSWILAGVSGVALDSSDNVFVTGSSGGFGATIACSSAGVPLWTNLYPNTHLNAIAVDASGNVFVTGSYLTIRTNNNLHSASLTVKYSSSVPPLRLDLQLLRNQLVLNWTNAGFKLQTAPALTGAFTNLLGATSPFTNPFTGPQQFFRLKGD